MSQERIDIEVTDKVDANVEAKLRGIAAAADKGDSAVARLKAQLAAINTGPVQKLNDAMQTVTKTINSELSATARLRQETTTSAAQDLKAATAKTKLADASSKAAISAAKQAVAESRASEASSKAALAALRLADAEEASAARKLKAAAASEKNALALEREAAAAKKVADVVNRPININTARTVPQGSGANLGVAAGSRSEAAAQTAAMSGAASNVGSAAKQATAAVEQLETVAVSRFARIKNAAISAFDTTRDAINHAFSGRNAAVTDNAANGLDRLAQGTEKVGNTAGRQRANMANLAAQIQDIGVSLAGGQNPLLVFIQQGSQISYIAGQMEGGFKALTIAAIRMLAPFIPIAVAIGGLYAGFRAFTSDIASSHKKELEAYAGTLGLTNKEMRKLANESVGANGKLKEFDTVTITMADSWNGFIATVKEGLSGLIAPFEGASSYFKTAWSAATGFAYYAFAGFYGAVMGGLRALGLFVIDTVPRSFKYAFEDAANAGLTAIEKLINLSVVALNKVGGWVNTISEKAGLGKVFDNLTEVSFPKFETSGRKAVKSLVGLIQEEFPAAVKEFDNTMKGFGARWEKNAADAAKKRLKTAADAIIANRNPRAAKKEADPKTQSDYLDDENKKLDNQLSRMKLLKDAREEQAQLDQIQEAFAKRRMPLDEAQLNGFRARIHAIQEFKYQQAEMDRIYDAANSPLRTYNASVAAATDLLARSAISQAQFTEEVNRASRAYKEATDPLFSMKEALTANETAAKLYGDQTRRNSDYENIKQAFMAKGIDITKNATAAQMEEVRAIMARNDALAGQQYVQSQVSDIVNPMKERDMFISAKAEMYAEIDRLRQLDYLSEAQTQQAKAQLENKFNNMRLEGASSFFGALSQLSQSKNSELAAIGKAAAVADATIKGYQAVQNTLATIPPPFNIPAAAAMAAVAGVQVANILSTPTNVGSYATGGQFMVQGEPGVDKNNIAMNVSRGERVTIETTAQQRENDTKGGGGGNVKIVNVTDKRDVHAAMGDDDGTKVILNIIRRNPNAIKALLPR